MNLSPFKLYGLLGCPHCADAERFLQENRLPGELVVCNDDPIVSAGIKQVTGQENYPVLLYRPTKEIVVGFKREDYERLAKAFGALIGASSTSVFGSGQQFNVQSATAPTEDSRGAN